MTRQPSYSFVLHSQVCAAFEAILCNCVGLDKLRSDQAGQALKFISDAQMEAKGSIPLAAAYNKAQPSTPAADHAEFDLDLKVCVEGAQNRVSLLLLLLRLCSPWEWPLFLVHITPSAVDETIK